jgi:hypothetical protein
LRLDQTDRKTFQTSHVARHPLFSARLGALSSTAQFWILLVFSIPSLICSFVQIYYLCFDRTLRQSLNTHVITVLLIFGIFSQTGDLSNYLTYLRVGYVWPHKHQLIAMLGGL